jgi:hypothetical protein
VDFKRNLFPIFVPKGRWILAGDEITGDSAPQQFSPEGAIDLAASCALPERKGMDFFVPVISSPANIRCASGAKHFF